MRLRTTWEIVACVSPVLCASSMRLIGPRDRISSSARPREPKRGGGDDFITNTSYRGFAQVRGGHCRTHLAIGRPDGLRPGIATLPAQLHALGYRQVFVPVRAGSDSPVASNSRQRVPS